jgi:hypothetical protein
VPDEIEVENLLAAGIPEIRIWIACLQQCLLDLQKNPADHSALNFIFQDNDFFLWLCRSLDMNPDALRFRVRKYLSRASKRHKHLVKAG